MRRRKRLKKFSARHRYSPAEHRQQRHVLKSLLGQGYGFGDAVRRSWKVVQSGLSKRGRHLDPALKLGSGLRDGKPHGYLGRHVLDLGDRHAHALVDVPWKALEVGKRMLFDPWKHAIHGRGQLLAIEGPKGGAIIESLTHVGRTRYEQLKRSGAFQVLPDGVLVKRRGGNIFVVP